MWIEHSKLGEVVQNGGSGMQRPVEELGFHSKLNRKVFQ